MTIKSLSSQQIALIIKKGKAYNSGFFVFKTPNITVYNTKNTEKEEKEHLQGSFVASKKIFTKAVERNKAKRLAKESFLEAVKKTKSAGLVVNQNKQLSIPPFVFLLKKQTLKNQFSEIVFDIEQFLLKNYII